MQTAHELVENYATDPQTKELLDNVEVFISPNSNPDGAHYSMYDSSVQRKTLPNYCPTTGNSDPAARTTWGTDMNRNSGAYSLFDGYFGASSELHERGLPGPVASTPSRRPATRVGHGHVPEHQVREQHPLLRRLLHVGAGLVQERRLPHDGAGAEHRHRELLLRGRREDPAAHQGLARHGDPAGAHGPDRRRALLAAGNSADEAWYRKGIIAYSFETGADRILNTTTGTARTSVGFQPCFAGVGTGGGQGSCPANGALANEGRDEALEFAAGNYGMVESAYDYGKDVTAPATTLDADGVTQSKEPINYQFTWSTRPRSSTTRPTVPRRRCRRPPTRPSALAASARS